jgi:hypothetical protein
VPSAVTRRVRPFSPIQTTRVTDIFRNAMPTGARNKSVADAVFRGDDASLV